MSTKVREASAQKADEGSTFNAISQIIVFPTGHRTVNKEIVLPCSVGRRCSVEAKGDTR